MLAGRYLWQAAAVGAAVLGLEWAFVCARAHGHTASQCRGCVDLDSFTVSGLLLALTALEQQSDEWMLLLAVCCMDG